MDQQEKWNKLQNLKQLLDSGFITPSEYQQRRAQLIDDLTGTTIREGDSIGKKRTEYPNLPLVFPHDPPDFKSIPEEKAIKHIFDLPTRTWKKKNVKVKIDTTPFARGALRFCYHMKEVSIITVDKLNPQGKETFVAKMSFDPNDNLNRKVYFADVEVQSYAVMYAKRFNSYSPPKTVDFVKAWVLELLQRPGKPIVGVEKYIKGVYRKHNNNNGYVNDDERNTPQAFSHFTYEISNHTVLICDIQGVSDLYTDPQLHSVDIDGYGKGNLGEQGFERFFATHRCKHFHILPHFKTGNAICRYLDLPPINPTLDVGTLPAPRSIIIPEENENHPKKFILLHPATPLLPKPLPSTISDDDEESCCLCCI